MSLRIWPTIADAVSAAARTASPPLVWDPTSHLLSRCAFGPTASSRAWLDAHGPDVWYHDQVAAGATYRGYGGDHDVAAQGPMLALQPYDVRMQLLAGGNEYGWDAMDQLTRVTLGLQVWSPAQLYEVLVDFFANHLNVPNHNGDLWNTRHTFDRDVVRRNAMGSFTTMLIASSKNPAMLQSLNLAQSTKTAVNENYGRELLEMHTIGRVYRENDVTDAARLLTGRTLDGNMHYVYDDYIHATGAVTVHGFRHPNSSPMDGQRGGDDLLRYLAGHPDTARHLAGKLCVRLVSDTPSRELVAAVAQAYLDGRTQIMPMVSTILRSAEFWASRGRKVRRPAENVVATMRVLGARADSLAKVLPMLHWVTAGMGNAPLDWAAPNGYPDVAAAWRSAGNLLQTWNMHLGLAGGWWSGLADAGAGQLYGGASPGTSGEAVAAMTQHLVGMRFSAAHAGVLQSFLDEPASTPISRSVLRWMAVPLAAVILDGPHHALR